MFKRYSVRNLSEDAIDDLLELKAIERREIGAILEDCINLYLEQYESDDDDSVALVA